MVWVFLEKVAESLSWSKISHTYGSLPRYKSLPLYPVLNQYSSPNPTSQKLPSPRSPSNHFPSDFKLKLCTHFIVSYCATCAAHRNLHLITLIIIYYKCKLWSYTLCNSFILYLLYDAYNCLGYNIAEIIKWLVNDGLELRSMWRQAAEDWFILAFDLKDCRRKKKWVLLTNFNAEIRTGGYWIQNMHADHSSATSLHNCRHLPFPLS